MVLQSGRRQIQRRNQVEFVPGVLPLDVLMQGFPRGRNLHLVGDDSGNVSLVAYHLLRHAESPALFDMSGQANLGRVQQIVKRSSPLIIQEESGDSAMKILRKLVSEQLCDVIVVDDIPSIVSDAERRGPKYGDELTTMELIVDTLRRIQLPCLRAKTTVIWVNQLRSNAERGQYVYGRDMLGKRMHWLVTCQKRKNISRDRFYMGDEVTLRVADGPVGRRVFAGLVDGEMSEGYWLVQEGIRQKVLGYDSASDFITCDTDFNYFEEMQPRWEMIDTLDHNAQAREEALSKLLKKHPRREV